MTGEKKTIYCDTNIYSRPFDDITQQRIYNEAIACSQIFEQARNHTIELADSDILRYEIENSTLERRLLIQPLLGLCAKRYRLTPEIRDHAELLVRTLGVAPRDALHLASAESGNADFFITCDDGMIRKAGASTFLMPVINPTDFIKPYGR